MSLKRVLGTLLATRMAGRGGALGGAGAATILGGLGRRGLSGKAGLAALGYMAYRAYRDHQARAAEPGRSASGEASSAGLGATLGALADRLTGGSHSSGDAAAGPEARPGAGPEAGPDPEARQAAEALSEEKALLLVRSMIAAVNADGTITAEERARIVQQLEGGGADAEDRRILERELANPTPLEALLGQVPDRETAQQVYLASKLAIDAKTAANRAYLARLRERLGLSQQEAAELDDLTGVPR